MQEAVIIFRTIKKYPVAWNVRIRRVAFLSESLALILLNYANRKYSYQVSLYQNVSAGVRENVVSQKCD